MPVQYTLQNNLFKFILFSIITYSFIHYTLSFHIIKKYLLIYEDLVCDKTYWLHYWLTLLSKRITKKEIKRFFSHDLFHKLIDFIFFQLS